MEQQPGQQASAPRFSDDGKWFWDGQQWRSAISDDGQWRWDGHQWQPYQQGQQPAAQQTAPLGAQHEQTDYYAAATGNRQPAAEASAATSSQSETQPGFQAGTSGSGVASSSQVNFDHSLVTTAFTLDGYRVTRNLGVVRGIIVRSRSVVGSIGAGVQQIFGGNISIFTELAEQSRRDAYELMIQHAAGLGANAVIGVRYDATEMAQGVTEVLAYGTAVAVEAV